MEVLPGISFALRLCKNGTDIRSGNGWTFTLNRKRAVVRNMTIIAVNLFLSECIFVSQSLYQLETLPKLMENLELYIQKLNYNSL